MECFVPPVAASSHRPHSYPIPQLDTSSLALESESLHTHPHLKFLKPTDSRLPAENLSILPPFLHVAAIAEEPYMQSIKVSVHELDRELGLLSRCPSEAFSVGNASLLSLPTPTGPIPKREEWVYREASYAHSLQPKKSNDLQGERSFQYSDREDYVPSTQEARQERIESQARHRIPSERVLNQHQLRQR